MPSISLFFDMSSSNDYSTVDKIRDTYDEGKPLFTRDVLEYINRHIEQGEHSVFVPRYIGEGKENALTIDEEYRARCPEE